MMSLNPTRDRLSSPWILLLTALVLGVSACSSSSEASTESADPGLLELESFLTNINDLSGERYCKLTVKLSIAPESTARALGEDPLRLARMRDFVLTTLAAKSFLELSEPEGKESFRTEIQDGLGKLVGDAQIREVLFSECVVQ